MLQDKKSLEQQLVERDFGEYFYYPTHNATLENIWAAQAGPAPLQELIKNEQASTLARLIAAEVLYDADLLYLQQTGMKRIAAVYCKALQEDVTGVANSWGLLWENDDMGPLGTNLRMCGTSANECLLDLLKDTRIRNNYEGSEEATVGNAAGFRVRDFAAYYLSKINQIALPYQRDVSKRDAAIDEMANEMSRQTKL